MLIFFFFSYFLPKWSVSSKLVISPPCLFWSPQMPSNSYSVLSIRGCVSSVVSTL